MKISLNWLKDYVDFNPKLGVEEIMWRLTEATAEVEKVHLPAEALDRVVVGKILEVKDHPDADKLKVCQVDVGSEKVQIVCGGINLQENMLVAVSLPGAQVRWHGEGEPVEVKKTKIRGVESIGMICAAEELGLENLFPNEGERDILDISHLKSEPGQDISEVMEIDDVVFEIDNHSITHRADLFSHIGFARECVALGLGTWKKKLDPKNMKIASGKKSLPLKVTISEKALSKNYHGTVIKNLSTKEAPLWMKARLHAVGIRSINAIVDITNYLMMEVGQPNHAFDLRVLEGKTFTNRLSKKGEKVRTLDGMERELEEGIIIAETENGIIDLAGIMGGEDSEVKEDTTDIYFHSAQFNNVMIRKAMISLGHRTEGGTMHEKDIEPERSELGFLRGLELFSEIFPEAVFEYETVHIQHESSPERSIQLPFQKITSHLGIEIPPEKAKLYLEELGFQVELQKESVKVKVPSWRINGVDLAEDIVEEIVRIHGYSHIPTVAPSVELAPPEKNMRRHMKRTLQSFLLSQGYREEVNYSFLSEDLLQKVQYPEKDHLIEIANPVSEDFRFMRPTLLPYLLQNFVRNAEKDISRIFEIGNVYERSEEAVDQKNMLMMLIASPKENQQLFYDVKTEVEALFQELSLPVSIQKNQHEFSYPGRCLMLESGHEMMGHIYELHPIIKEAFKAKGSIMVVEIELERVFATEQKEILYEEINRNPEALLDINVVVDQEAYMSEIEKVIRSVENQYLKEAKLIDLYEGENLGKGKKSFTFSLKYQHPQRTLKDEEIQNILNKLIKALEKEGGMVRR